VNTDCTGTYTVEISLLGSTTHAFFVIADGGNEPQIAILKDPGIVITCVAKKLYSRLDRSYIPD